MASFSPQFKTYTVFAGRDAPIASPRRLLESWQSCFLLRGWGTSSEGVKWLETRCSWALLICRDQLLFIKRKTRNRVASAEGKLRVLNCLCSGKGEWVLVCQPFGVLEKEEELYRYFALVGELLLLVVIDSPPKIQAFSSQALLKRWPCGVKAGNWVNQV